MKELSVLLYSKSKFVGFSPMFITTLVVLVGYCGACMYRLGTVVQNNRQCRAVNDIKLSMDMESQRSHDIPLFHGH